MSPQELRRLVLALLVAALGLSIVAKSTDSAVLGWASFALFALAVPTYFRWRKAVRAMVFDREAKTPDETRAGPDQ